MAHAAAIKTTLIIFGLATSVPLIVAGSAMLMAVLERYPILVWAGGALLGWVAGDIMVKDNILFHVMSPATVEAIHHFHVGPLTVNLAAVVGALFVVLFGWWMLRRRRAAHSEV
jgi:predicted tellurium resistance membrane protein TerC